MKEMTWQVLDSKYIIRRPWLTARVDRVLLPTGKINDEYYVLEYPTWVNIIARTDDGRFVLVRQYRHGTRRTSFEICAGVVENGETPLDAAQRELSEETGYGGGQWRELMTLSPNASTCNNLTHCYVAEGVRRIGEQHLDATEDIEIHLRTAQEVRTMLEQGCFLQALMAAPLWRYFAENKA